MHNNAAFGICLQIFGSAFLCLSKHFVIRDLDRMVFAVLVLHFIYNACFLYAAVAYGGKTGIPVVKAVFAHNFCLIDRFIENRKINSLCLAVSGNQLFAMLDIFFFQLAAEPLVDLCLCLCAFYNIQPVMARPPGIL